MAEDLPDDSAPADAEAIDRMRAAAPAMHNGTYTVSHPKHGHYTVKLHTAMRGSLAGKRVFSLLVGPDNTSDYKGVAFWNDKERYASVWRRFRGPSSSTVNNGYNWQKDGWSAVEKKIAILLDLALRGSNGHWSQAGYQLQRASRCVRCNRELTTPESIEYGIGPICASRA